jgi:hypothetical protein
MRSFWLKVDLAADPSGRRFVKRAAERGIPFPSQRPSWPSSFKVADEARWKQHIDPLSRMQNFFRKFIVSGC